MASCGSPNSVVAMTILSLYGQHDLDRGRRTLLKAQSWPRGHCHYPAWREGWESSVPAPVPMAGWGSVSATSLQGLEPDLAGIQEFGCILQPLSPLWEPVLSLLGHRLGRAR